MYVPLYVPPLLDVINVKDMAMSAVCRGKQRCVRCEGEHDYSKCEQEISPKCNCGGEHIAQSMEDVKQDKKL